MGLDMKNIKVQDLEPGMVTAKDILATSGHLLLPAGTTLTTRYIRMLHARQIPSVTIDAGDEAPPLESRADSEPHTPHPSEGRLIRMMERLQFNNLEHPFIKELVRVCTMRLIDRA